MSIVALLLIEAKFNLQNKTKLFLNNLEFLMKKEG